MFPWLFPYGLGGIGSTTLANSKLSDAKHKQLLMLYHDKRFQMDLSFPFVAFSHEQMKQATTQVYLLANSSQIDSIYSRLLSADKVALQDLSTRMANGEFVTPSSDTEKQCFSLLQDMDAGSKRTKGSMASKKNMHHEIWSLITHTGAPTWYFTLAPCDFKHPICIYYADTKESFEVTIPDAKKRRALLSANPAAGACFFHFLVTLFLDIVIGTPSEPGLFGPMAAYYCTVEQQGRLALHLHGVAHAKNSLSPLQIRKQLLDHNSDFQTQLLLYLESVCVGELFRFLLRLPANALPLTVPSAPHISSGINPINLPLMTYC